VRPIVYIRGIDMFDLAQSENQLVLAVVGKSLAHNLKVHQSADL
jgi:hypothetical protein